MSDVSNSILRCTIIGCGGIGGEPGRLLFGLDLVDVEGNMVMGSREGREDEDIAPSRWMSP